MIFDQQDINRLQKMAKKMGIGIKQYHSDSPGALSMPYLTPSTWFVDLLEAIVEKCINTESCTTISTSNDICMPEKPSYSHNQSHNIGQE